MPIINIGGNCTPILLFFVFKSSRINYMCMHIVSNVSMCFELAQRRGSFKIPIYAKRAGDFASWENNSRGVNMQSVLQTRPLLVSS